MKAALAQVTTTTKWIAGSLSVACLIFTLSPGVKHLVNNPTGWEFREQFVYLSGLAAMSLMVLSMVISIRHPRINHWMHGLDKAYVVHKWTGIVSTILVVFHWLGEKAPEWLVELGLVPDPGELTDGSKFSRVEVGLFKTGVFLAEWVFYGLIILVIIALVTRIPYHIFRKSHKVFPVVFIIAAYHGATAPLKEHWYDTLAGYMLLLMLIVGVVAALLVLAQQVGASRKLTAVVQQIDQHEHGVLDIQLVTNQKPFFYQPGQYAFLKFAHDSEPHPFTIASAGYTPDRLRFAIKELGGFTAGLHHQLQAGQSVEVEGPYGEFTFEDVRKRQVWVAGGIGVTPFLARLDYLIQHGGTQQPIDFWYSTRNDEETMFPSSLKALCQQCGVNFYHLNSTRKEHLTADMIQSVVGNVDDTSVWFCGPPAFAKCLINGLKTYEFNRRHFHYDSFSMR